MGPAKHVVTQAPRLVVEELGTDRVMDGSDWPVLTIAGREACA